MKSLAVLLLVIFLYIAHAKSKNQPCARNGGRCITKTSVSRRCIRLHHKCGSDAVCCKKIATKREGNWRRKCRKTRKKCSKEGGKCVSAKSYDCATVTIDKLCKGRSCTCCLGDKTSCGSSPNCKSNGGFCINRRKTGYCEGGTINEGLCDGRKCACCLLGQVVPEPPDNDCQCGQANEVRIVGGEEVSPNNKYPWMVGIVHLTKDGFYSCGAAIINNRYVITAAHCLFDLSNGKALKAKDIKIGLADHIQFSPDDDVDGVTETVAIDDYIVHESFDSTFVNLDGDIALIRLKKPLDLSANKEIKPVCLPKDADETYEGFDAIVAGWGRLDYSDYFLPDTLSEVTVPILSPECEGDFPSDIEITENMICAGIEEGGKDACSGDSGGPLVVKEGTTYTLVGIVSFGIGCAKPNSPGVYTRVTQYLDWIAENTSDGSYCS